MDMKVDSKSSQLGAVSTWMGDLIRIPTEGFYFYFFFFFFFFCFHFINLFLYFLLLIFIALSVCLLFIFKGREEESGSTISAKVVTTKQNKHTVND